MRSRSMLRSSPSRRCCTGCSLVNSSSLSSWGSIRGRLYSIRSRNSSRSTPNAWPSAADSVLRTSEASPAIPASTSWACTSASWARVLAREAMALSANGTITMTTIATIRPGRRYLAVASLASVAAMSIGQS